MSSARMAYMVKPTTLQGIEGSDHGGVRFLEPVRKADRRADGSGVNA
jgi:hypothetical protein